MPLGRTVWQLKAELANPDIKEFADEMGKPQPYECLKGGGTYVFVSQNPPNNEDDTEAVLKSVALSNGFGENQVRLYAQTKLAGFARRHPTLSLLPYFQFQPVGLEPFELWEKDHASIAFEPAAHRERFRQLCEVIRPIRFHAAVTGATGVGKSRLVLEAIRSRSLEPYVAYARGPGPNVDRLVEHIRMHERACILVVDECDRAQASVLRDRLATTPAGLITIEVDRGGLASRTPDGDALLSLEPLSVPVISKVLERNAGLGPDARSWVAQQSGGFIKLAKLLGDELARDKSAFGNLASMSGATQVENALMRMLGNDKNKTDLLKLFACFSSIEHNVGTASHESGLLASKLDITQYQLDSLVARVKREQILMEGGGYIYVTPDLMAQWLQESFLREHGSLFGQWLSTLPERLQHAHSRQLARLRGSQSGREWAARLVRADGPFGDLLTRRQPWADSALLALCAAAKEAAIEYVAAWAHRTSDAAQQVVERDVLRFILFRLMRTPRGFEALFKLLVDAFESTGCDKDGAFWRLMQGMLIASGSLSSTLAPYKLVVAAAREQILCREADVRAALIEGLGMGLVSPLGAGYSEYDRDPGDDGREAASLETVVDVCTLIREALDDRAFNVQKAAAKFFIKGTRILLSSPLSDTYLSVAGRAAKISGETGALAAELDRFLLHDSPSPELSARVQGLQRSLATSIEERIRIVLQGWSVGGPIGNPAERPTAVSVAQELVELDEHNLSVITPLFFEESAVNRGELMSSLGKNSGSPSVWPSMLTAARMAQNAWPAALLLATARDSNVVLSPNARTLLIGDRFDNEVAARAITMSASSDDEVAAVAERLSRGSVDPEWTRNATMGLWNERVTSTAVESLLRGLLAHPNGTPIAVSLAHRAIESNQSIPTNWLLQSIGKGTAQVSGHDLWTWSQLAAHMAKQLPVELFDVVFNAITEHGVGDAADEVETIFAMCCKHVPALAERLLDLWDQHPYLVSSHFASTINEHISVSRLIQWANEDAERQRSLGRILVPRNTPKTVALIEHFGDTGPLASALESLASSGTWSGNISGFYEARGRQWMEYAESSTGNLFIRFARRVGSRLLRAAERARIDEAAENARDR